MSFAALICAIGLSDCAAPEPDLKTWRGVYTTESVAGCTIHGQGEVVKDVTYGYGVFGKDKALGNLVEIADVATQFDEELKKLAIDGGKNAVVGARVEIGYSSDDISETGMNWKDREGVSFNASNSFLVFSYGTAVSVSCP